MKRIAIALPVSLLLFTTGCTSPAPAPSTGMVLLPEGLTLGSATPASNLGLILDRRGDGQARVLAADGTDGWTSATLSTPNPVTVECPPQNVSLFRESPDELSPESAQTLKPTADKGSLLGAAVKTYPASQKQLLAPPRLRILLPVVKVRCGVEGYAPLDWLSLRYTAPSLDAIKGLVRGPFLGPFAPSLRQASPSTGTPATVFLEDKLQPQPTTQAYPEVHAFYRNPAGSAQTLTVYGNGPSRLYRFSQPPLNLVLPDYAPYPLRIEVHDGNWLVETVSIFGDGAYSTLFHLSPDGAFAFHPLSRSSGEEAKDVEASWQWQSGKLQITRPSR
ncbi:MAG: hypothetical protein JNK87_40365 [Bryobacterales bacterium]|nr:hypothetical protein [Bryobacterales bacterium]